MLGNDDAVAVASGFEVYDHDWRYYAVFLGEPFLIENYLAYFDGRVVYVCGFTLGDVHKECDFSVLESIVRHQVFKDAELIDFWGRFSNPPSAISLGEHEYRLVQPAHYYDSHDAIVPVAAFDYATAREARLARNAARNQDYHADIIRRGQLTWQHIALMEEFMTSHEVPATLVSFALAVPSIIKADHVVLSESWQGSRLAGFAVVSQPAQGRAVVLQGFYERKAGSRASDAVMDRLLRHCSENGINYLHLGYSPNSSLLRFKRKWGAVVDGPVFREAFFARGEYGVKLVESGYFPWRERLLAAHIKPFKSS